MQYVDTEFVFISPGKGLMTSQISLGQFCQILQDNNIRLIYIDKHYKFRNYVV